MNTSFLYHMYGLNGLKCATCHYKGSDLILDVEYSKRKTHCPNCGKTVLVKNGYRMRRIIVLPIGMKRTILNMKV